MGSFLECDLNVQRKCEAFAKAGVGNLGLANIRSNLTDCHLQQCLRTASSTYGPNYNALAENLQCQPSH